MNQLQSSQNRFFISQPIPNITLLLPEWSNNYVEELETLPAGTSLRTHHQLPGRERRIKKKHLTIFREYYNERTGHCQTRPTLDWFQRQYLGFFFRWGGTQYQKLMILLHAGHIIPSSYITKCGGQATSHTKIWFHLWTSQWIRWVHQNV